MKCNKAPENWSCSRVAGHDGPCAARPIMKPLFPGFLMRWLCKQWGHSPWFGYNADYCARCGVIIIEDEMYGDQL